MFAYVRIGLAKPCLVTSQTMVRAEVGCFFFNIGLEHFSIVLEQMQKMRKIQNH